MIALAFITFAASAQQQQTPAKQAPANEQQNRQYNPKDEWTKQYNAWKEQIDKYNAKVKEAGDKYPDFTKEVSSFNQMITGYNEKIARYDAATAEEKAKYNDMMKSDAQKIKDEQAKLKAMYEKNWPKAAEQKGQPAGKKDAQPEQK